MAEKLLINVAHEETRVALVESGRLANFEIITSLADNNKGSIFKGIVHRVNSSLQAAFVDYGAEKQGFLPLAEVHPRYYPKGADKSGNRRQTITDVLQQGQEVMVQVVKDEIGQKGATLTTYISLAGRSLAIEADSEKAGISRRVSQDERNRLRKVMNQLDVPDGFGAIMRTAAADQGDDDIHSNQEYLMHQWTKVQERFKSQKGPGLIHQELPLPLRFIRDSLSNTVDEILIDDEKTFQEVRNFCVAVAPELVPRVKHYNDPRPLFFRFQIEDQIDDIFARKIDLPSGGSIVIDQAEALVAIDVNSGRVKTDDIEDTATKTNLEAAAEIARQLKIRDRGGLIVVDFIDMRDKDNIRKVEEAIRQAFASDKAKVKFSRISEFGLMEISRQRLQSSVARGSFTSCATCGGTGQVRSIESSSLFILRRIKEILIRGNYERVEAKLPVGIANYLLNRKRQDLVALERQTGSSIEVVAEEHCPPMKAFFELTTRPGASQRKARRVVQEIDLVRSEVDKRDLEDGEVVEVARDTSTDAEPSVFAASREKLEAQNRNLEAEMASRREIESAQKEADESLRRQEELRLEKERLEAEAERIRALDAARRASLGFWGRVKAFFGGLPPIEADDSDDDNGRARRKRRDDDGKRPERDRREDRRRDKSDRTERDRKRDGDKPDGDDRKRDGDKDRARDGDREKKRDGDDRKRDGDRDRKRDGDDRRGRQRYPARVEGAGELIEAGGAVVQTAVGSSSVAAEDGSRKKRRRRRGSKGRDGEGLPGGELEDGVTDGNGDDGIDEGVATADTDGDEGAEERPPREGRGRGRERDGRGRGRDRRGRKEEGGEAEAQADAEPAAESRSAAPAPAPEVKAPKGVGVVDLRQDKARTPAAVVPLPVAVPKPVTPRAPAPAAEGSKPSVPKFGGVIDLRGGAPAPKPAPKPEAAKADIVSAIPPATPGVKADTPSGDPATPAPELDAVAAALPDTSSGIVEVATEAAVDAESEEVIDESTTTEVTSEAAAETPVAEDAEEGEDAERRGRRRRGGRGRRSAATGEAGAKASGGGTDDA